jgi:hypothetical protein
MRTFLLTLLFPLMSFAQETQYIEKGLIQLHGNIGFGSFVSGNGTNVYLNSGLNYFTSNSVSLNSDVNVFLASTSKNLNLFKMNHSLLVGSAFHLKTKGNIDPYLSLMPGIAVSRVRKEADLYDEYPSLEYSKFRPSANPIFAVGAGVNYFSNKIFNLYFHVQYVAGKHFSDAETLSLNEVKLSLGLGWHLWAQNNRLLIEKGQ